jgi:hypothetical protein
LRKEIASALALISTLAVLDATAYEGTTVNGETYLCDNRCSVNTSVRPPRVKDCCGGSVYKKVG